MNNVFLSKPSASTGTWIEAHNRCYVSWKLAGEYQWQKQLLGDNDVQTVGNVVCFTAAGFKQADFFQNVKAIRTPNKWLHDGKKVDIKKVGDQAFKDCTKLEAVEISEGVDCIGDRAFIRCSGLKSLVLPSSLKSVSAYAFYVCTGLAELSLSLATEHVYEGAFADCNNVKVMAVLDTIAIVNSKAFLRMTNVQQVIIRRNGGDFEATKQKLVDCGIKTDIEWTYE